MYPGNILVPFYRQLLDISQGRGEHSLAKLDAFLFRLYRQIKIDRAAGIYIILPPDPHFFRYLIKSHERHISQAIKTLVKQGDVVIDIGANIGYFSAFAAAAAGKSGRVFCFEPEAQNFAYLQANCRLFQTSGFACEPVNLAVSNISSTATLNIHRFSTYHSLADGQLDKVEGTQQIHTITLDEWVESQAINKIALLKIDTEGHEPKVLAGARKLFTNGAVDFAILECRSEAIAIFVDEFAQEFNLYQLAWDGQAWHAGQLRSLPGRTECILSTQYLSPAVLS